jgi:uncharacterized DUF497 family protein
MDKDLSILLEHMVKTSEINTENLIKHGAQLEVILGILIKNKLVSPDEVDALIEERRQAIKKELNIK